MTTLREMQLSSRVSIPSGHGASEVWTDTSAAKLNPMFKTFREVLAQQLNSRFQIDGAPDEHTLLALKMNPGIDTSPEGALFKAKPAALSLMNAAYDRSLRMRYRLRNAARARQAAKSATSTFGQNANTGASVMRASATATSAQSTSSGTLPLASPSASASMPICAAGSKHKPKPSSAVCTKSSSKRPKMGAIASNTYGPSNLSVVVGADSEIEDLESEKAAFRQAAKNIGDYVVNGKFDKNKFWSAHQHHLPIHFRTYVGDCACKKAASANVETVFCGAKKLSDSASTLGDDLLAAYVINNINWELEFLRPDVHDIVCAYLDLYGADSELPEMPEPGSESEEGEEGEESEEQEQGDDALEEEAE